MRILAIDPGTTKSGWCLYDAGEVKGSGDLPNQDLLHYVMIGGVGLTPETYMGDGAPELLVIEMVQSFGMAVGKEVFETVVWVGRFLQAWREPEKVMRLYRRDVKVNICCSARATDSNIWHALLDRIGPVGTKKEPGPLYGVKSHARAALALAVTVDDQLRRAG